MRRSGTALGSTVVLAGWVSGCLLDWDGVDPRAEPNASGQGGAGTVGTTGAGGSATTGAAGGGTTTTATTVGAGGSGDWLDDDYGHRRGIDVAADVTVGSFPLRVRLTPQRIDYAATQSSGGDLVVYDGEGQPVPFAIENWTPGGESNLWLRPGNLAGGATLWLYHDGPVAMPGGNPFQGFDAVFHFNQDLTDATNNGHGGSPVGPLVDESGKVAGGIASGSASGGSDHGTTGAIDDLFAGGGTISAWIRPMGLGGNGFGRVMDKSSDNQAKNGWALQLAAGAGGARLRFERGFSTMRGAWTTTGVPLSFGSWHHVAVVYDDSSIASDPAIYVDGVAVGLDESDPPVGAVEPDAGVSLRIGNSLAGNRVFDGIIDEVRLEKTARGPAFIDADERSVDDELLSFGPDETRP